MERPSINGLPGKSRNTASPPTFASPNRQRVSSWQSPSSVKIRALDTQLLKATEFAAINIALIHAPAQTRQVSDAT